MTNAPPSTPSPSEDLEATAAPAVAPATGTRPGGQKHTLDLLRALAALAVVAFHYRGVAERDGLRIPGLEVGDVGVQVFFVLSGFLITTSVIVPLVLSRRDYFVNRAVRILPLAWFAVIAVVVVSGRGVLDRANPRGDLVTHALMIHGLFPDFRTSIIGPLWTLSIEWQFYLLVLVAAGALRHPRGRWVVAGAMVVGALAYRVWVWDRHQGSAGDLTLFTKQLPGVADQFAVGVAAALAVQVEGVRRFVSRPGVRVVGLLVGLAGAGALLAVYAANTPGSPEHRYWANPAMVILWPLAFAFTIAVIVVFIQQHEERFSPVIRWSGLGFVGLISYSVYVFHLPIMGETDRVLNRLGLDLVGWTRVAFVLALVLAISTVSYLVVERPPMQLRRHLRSGGRLDPARLVRLVVPRR